LRRSYWIFFTVVEAVQLTSVNQERMALVEQCDLAEPVRRLTAFLKSAARVGRAAALPAERIAWAAFARGGVKA